MLLNVWVNDSLQIQGCRWNGESAADWRELPGPDAMFVFTRQRLPRGDYVAYFWAEVPESKRYECVVSIGSGDLYGRDQFFRDQIESQDF